MRTSALLAAVAATALLASCDLGAPAYPQFGEADYRVEGMTASATGGSPTRTLIYRDGPKMRVEATLPQIGEAIVVFDDSTNAAYVLNPTSQTLNTAPGTTPPPAATPPATTGAVSTDAPPTPPAQTAAGVAVRIENANAPQPLESAWAALGADNARHVGGCEVAGERGQQWRPREASAGVERVACITDDGIVLRVTEDDRVLWEATSVQRGQQDAALFGVPPGYQLIDPQAAAAAVSENLEQLDSVTGASPPTQP